MARHKEERDKLALGTCSATGLNYFELTTTSDMLACMADLIGLNFASTLECAKDGNGTVVYTLSSTYSSTSSPQVTRQAHIGDFFIWDGVNLDVLNAADFAAHYTKLT